jgi:hypothetical protein
LVISITQYNLILLQLTANLTVFSNEESWGKRGRD